MGGRASIVAAATLAAAVSGAEGPRVVRVHGDPAVIRSLRAGDGILYGWTGPASAWSLSEKELRAALADPDHVVTLRGIGPLIVRDRGLDRDEARRPARRPEHVAGWPVTDSIHYREETWHATFGGGLRMVDGRRLEESPDEVSAVAVLGELLVMADGEGLAVLDGERLARVPLPGPRDEDVSALAWDGKSMWVGFFDGGVAKLQDGRWQPVETPGPPARGWINALAWDGEALWVGSDAGLGVVRAGSLSVVPVAGFEEKVVGVRTDGGTLVVTESRAVAVREGEGWKRHELPWDSLHTAFVHEDTLWAAGMAGVLRRDGERWRRYSQLNGALPDSWVTALEPWGEGMLVGTYDAGLLWMDREGHARLVDPSAWVNPNALAKGDGWWAAGLLDDGLLFRGPERERSKLRKAAGLPANDVTAMLRVGDTLWVGTRGGVVELALEP